MSDSMNSAISEFVLNRAQLMKRDPADCLWIGDLIAAFINSQEYAQMAISAAVKMSFSVQELRPEVMAFALLMEARLREKDVDRKGNSWKTADADNLLVHATAKTYSIDAALSIRGDEVEAAKHAVDLANYCMMIADVGGVLNIPEEESSEWLRDDEATFCAFLLIGDRGITKEVVASWTDAQCRQAEAWALLTHYAASDNNVTVPPCPDFIASLERKADNGGVGWAGLDQSRTEPLDIPAFLRKSKD